MLRNSALLRKRATPRLMFAFPVRLADCHASQIKWRINQNKADANTEVWRRRGGLEHRRRPSAHCPRVGPTVLCQDHGKPMIIRVDND